MSLLNEAPKRRKSDREPIACQLTKLWDWIDRRDIDKHAVSLAILWGTVKVTQWAMAYAETHAGPDVALVIAAVAAPYMALQAAAIGFYFNARRGGEN